MNSVIKVVLGLCVTALLFGNAFATYVDVTDDYGSGGAVGNGSTDDTDAIEEAISAASALSAVSYTHLTLPTN